MAKASTRPDNAVASESSPPRVASPPYISYLTFRNMVDWLEKEGIPLRFDRSFWQKKYSGTVGPLLMSGLRFLHLLEEDKPCPGLERLVEAKGEDRKAVLADILRQSYTEINFEELPRATPSMVAEWLTNYGLQGDTLRKAESFFINAAKDANITMSNAVRKKARVRSARANHVTSRGVKKVEAKGVAPPSVVDQSESGAAQTKGSQREQGNLARISLASGGEVTLGLSVDLFTLNAKDREFVFRLVDLVRNYQTTGREGAAGGNE